MTLGSLVVFSVLKEVVGSAASHMWFPPPEQECDGTRFNISRKFWEKKGPGGRVELEEGVLQGVIQLHNGSLHTVHN